MVCPKCGKNLENNVSVCDQCGTPLTTSDSPEIVVPSDFHFKDDRVENSLEDALPEGLAIINGEKIDTEKKKAGKKLPKNVQIALIIVLVLVVLGLLVVFLNASGMISLF